MTTEVAERRKGQIFRLLGLAALLVAIAAVTSAIEMRSARPDLAAGAVVPQISDAIGDARRIVVVSGDASYRIERVERAGEQVWVMRDRGDYPVLESRIEQLGEGLAALQYVRRMTADAAKHARLGVDDPRQGGRGILLQVEDVRGALLVNLILGVEPDGGLYVRQPDSNQAYAVRGALPPFRDVGSWLDLRPLPVEPERLARVEIVPAEGRPYVLARATAEEQWRIIQPALASQASLGAIAERLTQVSPVDVQTAPAIQGAPVARLRAVTFDGVLIDAELVPSDGQVWLKLVARASSPEQEPAALDLNNRIAGWAFALSDLDAEALAPPLAVLTLQ